MEAQKQKKNPVMRFRRLLFWDVDPKTIDPKKHARYIIERVLDFGNDKEVRRVFQTYPRSIIRSVVLKSRGIHPRSKALWELLTK